MANIKNEYGLLFETDNYTIVKKHLEVNQLIEKHYHPQYEVLVTIIDGSIMADLDNEAPFPLNTGDVLQFDGDLNIGFKGLAKATEFTVTLISKNKKPI